MDRVHLDAGTLGEGGFASQLSQCFSPKTLTLYVPPEALTVHGGNKKKKKKLHCMKQNGREGGNSFRYLSIKSLITTEAKDTDRFVMSCHSFPSRLNTEH